MTRMLILTFLLGMVSSSSGQCEMIMVNGFKVEISISGLENNQEDKPVVVFENGMASGFSSWDSVASAISKTHVVFRHNRPRIGNSENDSLPPTTFSYCM